MILPEQSWILTFGGVHTCYVGTAYGNTRNYLEYTGGLARAVPLDIQGLQMIFGGTGMGKIA